MQTSRFDLETVIEDEGLNMVNLHGLTGAYDMSLMGVRCSLLEKEVWSR